MAAKIGVGIIGASADRAWGSRAHVPAIKASPDFALRAVSTSRRESAERASAAFGVPGYADYHSLIAHQDVDLAVVAVKVPSHAQLVRAAIEAGKAIFCEWPLGNGLKETEQLAEEARSAGVRNFVGLQTRSSPGICHLRQLLRDNYPGKVLSTSVIGSGGGWGGAVEPADAYLLNQTNGASMLTIPFGHAIDRVCYWLGEPEYVVSEMATRRTTATEEGTGKVLPVTVADQIVLGARLKPGTILSAHYRGGMSAGANFLWEINGTQGDLVITAASGHIQMNELTIQGARKGEKLGLLSAPDECRWAPKGTPEGFPFNIGQAYVLIAQDLRDGGRRAPTFDDAVRCYRMLDAMERSAKSGERTEMGEPAV